MNSEVQKIEIVSEKPTHIDVKFVPSGQIVKMSKRFLQKRLDGKLYEVVNARQRPSVI